MDDEKGSVEHLKDKLYSRTQPPKMEDVRAPLTKSEAEAPVAWHPDEPEGAALPPRRPRPFMPTLETRMSFATKFFIVSVGFFVVALAVAAIAFFIGPNTISPQNIDVTVVAPSLIDGGKEADLQIVIDNKNPAALQLVDLVIDYPDGSRDPKDPTQSLLHERQSVGTVGAASSVKRTASVLLYGTQGEQETVRATIEYSVAGSNAVFTREGDAAITIGSSPVSVTVDTPSEAIAGQSFPLDVTVRSNATTPVDNVVVQGQLPFGYSMQSSTPTSTIGTLWRLGTLNPGDSQVIHITGTIDGQDGDTRVFKFLVGQDADTSDTQVAVPFLTMPATVTVSRPFIGATIAVGGQSGSTISLPAGGSVSGTISWQNNLQTPVTNLQVTLKLAGPMLDKSSVTAANGFYDSKTNSIVWTQTQDPELAQVAPGAAGQLQFSFNTIPPGQGGVVYTNPTANLNLSLTGTRPGQGDVPEAVTAAAATTLTFASALSVDVSGTYLSGANPPVAEASTAYTIDWSVKNSSNSVGGASVSTVLPPYVTFVSGGTGLSYDASTRTVTWAVGDLKPGIGYTSAALQNSFQITLTPSVSQVGQTAALTGQTTLTGTDRYTSTTVQASAAAPTTLDNVGGSQ